MTECTQYACVHRYAVILKAVIMFGVSFLCCHQVQNVITPVRNPRTLTTNPGVIAGVRGRACARNVSHIHTVVKGGIGFLEVRKKDNLQRTPLFLNMLTLCHKSYWKVFVLP